MFLHAFGITILLSGLTYAAFLDDVQKEKDHLKSTLTFLEKIESKEPDENGICQNKPVNCAEIFVQGSKKSGTYTIFPSPLYKKSPFQVYCDMTTDGGGWTIFQRRDNYTIQENFYRGWTDYKQGFGSIRKDFWLGNDNLYLLTNQNPVSLRIDMEDFEGNKRYAHYDKFQIGNDHDSFKLSVSGYTGDLGDDLAHHNLMNFVTFNRNDVKKCSNVYKGGWWYGLNGCHRSNLNGLYLRGKHTSFADGVEWYSWKGHYYSLKKVEMKIRPVNFVSLLLENAK